MRTLFQLEITLRLRGPVLTKSTGPAGFGLDAAVARDLKTNRPMIPGSLIEGRLRESLRLLHEDARLEGLLGKETTDETHNEPVRGSLCVGDLVATTDGCGRSSISRIAVDSTLGSARGEMLRVIEAPFRAGEEAVFEGTAGLFASSRSEADAIARLLRMGLLWQTQIGALRTTGFGCLLGATVDVKSAEVELVEISGAPAALDLAVAPLGPLCITRPKIGDNLFESDTVLPGNLLAGAVMETARALDLVAGFHGEFDRIRFRHAFPTTGKRARPRPLPLSTVKAGKQIYDVHAKRDPVLLADEEGRLVAPAFPIDWKHHNDALEALDWVSPARELRVRTAIDGSRRKASDGQLFAWEMIHPFLDDAGKTPVHWRGRIDLADVPAEKRTAVAATLARVLAHLSFVSKTKARCRVSVEPVEADSPDRVRGIGETLALVLRTPALLADPRFQDLPGVPKSGAVPPGGMLALYRATFDELSGGSLALSHHFARQHLEGGNYLGTRFQRKSGRPYNPWLLTDAGSVFVFTVTKADLAAERLAAWLASGLPVPEWAVKPFGRTWCENPYLPENGFGEIAVHEPAFETAEGDGGGFSLADPILPPNPVLPA